MGGVATVPEIYHFRCTRCDFAFPKGWGGYTYALDAQGRRVVCPHPDEMQMVFQVTGVGWSEAQAAGRLGHASHCVCFDCAEQFDLDLDRDVKQCPKCGSLQVRSAYGSIGCPCPKCKAGRVEQVAT